MRNSAKTLCNISIWCLLTIAVGTFGFLVLRCFSPAEITRYLELTLEVEQKDILELYWAEGEKYSPKQHASRELFPDDEAVTYRIPLPNQKLTHFRLDPVVEKGAVRLLKTAYGEVRTGVYREIDNGLWKSLNAIGSLQLSPQGLMIISEEGAVDPQLQLIYPLEKVVVGANGLLAPGCWILILVCLFGQCRLRRSLRKLNTAEASDEPNAWTSKACVQWGLAVASFGIIGALTVPALSWVAHEAYREKAFLEVDLFCSHNVRNGGESQEQALVQLFYDSGKGFWHGNSVTRIIASNKSRETLRFYLDTENIYELRFDPLNAEFEMEIYAMRLGSTHGTLSQEIDLKHIHPRQQIGQFERRPDRLILGSVPGANDPQLKINLEKVFSAWEIRRWDILSWKYGLLLGIAIALPLLTFSAIHNAGQGMAGQFTLLRGWENWFHGRNGKRLTLGVLALLMILAIGIRILGVYAVYPGDAPDEKAHMGLIVAISDGQFLAVEEEFPMTGYAFSIYNPLAYLPSVWALNASWKQAEEAKQLHSRDVFLGKLEELKQKKEEWRELDSATRPAWYDYLRNQDFNGHNQFSFETTYMARWGNLIWALAYLAIIPLVLKPYRNSEKILLFGLLAFTPQILFVQSYVNLDSMGLFVALYLFWAMREERWWQAALACLLTAFCKMNFYCIYFLPAVYLVYRYPWQWKIWIQRSLLLFLPSFIVLLAWNWYVHFDLNTGMVGGALSIASLYGVEPGGSRVFQWAFMNASLDSAFGLFGYLYQPVPIAWAYPLWKFALIPLGILALLVSVVRAKPWTIITRRATAENVDSRSSALAVGVFAVLLVNIVIHYYASYGNNGYSPQGRYFFGSLVMLFCYWPLVTRYLRNGLAPLRWFINLGLALLFFFFCFYSLKDMNYHETRFGFSPDWTDSEEPMQNLWELIDPYYPF